MTMFFLGFAFALSIVNRTFTKESKQ